MDRELSDLIHPVVIKELRESLRSNLFVVTFLACQFGMVAFIILLLFHQKGSEFFWVILGSSLMFTPIRALFAISQERKHQTLEPMLLTSSARGIVLGKWLALMIQNVHFCSSLLPYLLVEYLLGGADVIEEVITLLALLFFSASLSSGALMLSASHTVAGRAVCIVIYLFIHVIACVGWMILPFLEIVIIAVCLALAQNMLNWPQSVGPPAETDSPPSP